MLVNDEMNSKKTKAVHGPVNGKKGEKTAKKLTKHDEFVQGLRESAKLLGYLHPVLNTRFGVAAGNTRLKADPNWPVKE